MAATRDPTAPTARPRSALPLPHVEPARTVVDCIFDNVRWRPNHPALVIATPRDRRAVSYRELGELIAEIGAGLDRGDVPPASRVLLMAPPSLHFYALALGVLACGRSLVVVDGRMRRRRMVHALRTAAPHVVIATPNVMRWWPVIAPLRRARRFTINGSVFGTHSAETLPVAHASLIHRQFALDAPAIIAFSSGSTGEAKQITRSHDVLLAQHRALAAAFPPPADDVNLPGFPMAVLHNLCCGTTSVLPDAELRSTIAVDAGAAIGLIDRAGVTSVSSAPRFARAVSRRAVSTGRLLERVDHIVVGGGPVSRALCGEMLDAFPNAQASVLYGATEAEPIATTSMREVFASDGEGFLVGKPVPEVEVMIDAVDGDAGEVLVRGAHVVRPRQAADGWHHTSDIARLDEHGRLWLLGRVDDAIRHRGRLVYPGAVEACALSVSGVNAAGFVAHARAPEGELAIEIARDAARAPEVMARVTGALARHGFETIRPRAVPRIPVDARHESKVARADLARVLARMAR